MRDELWDASALRHMREIKLHVCRVFLEFIKQFLWRRTDYIVNLNYLVELVISWKEWKQC